MSFILEMLPLLSLGLGYLVGKQVNPEEAIYFLSYGAILGTIAQFVIYKVRKQKMQKMTFITGIILIVFSSLTVILRNPMFVYSKPTVIAFAFAIAFFVYYKVKKTTILEVMMGKQFELPAANWKVLNWAWILFQVSIGIANLVIILQINSGKLDEVIWVNFKVWVLPITTFIFLGGQMAYMLKKGKMIEVNDDGNKDKNKNDSELEG